MATPCDRRHSAPSADWRRRASRPAWNSRWRCRRSARRAASRRAPPDRRDRCSTRSKCAVEQPPGFAREQIAMPELRAVVHVAFDRVRDRVVTGGRGHRARLRSASAADRESPRETPPSDRRTPSSRACRHRRSARSSAPRCRCRPWSEQRSSAASAAWPCRSPSNRACLPPLVRTKLMPLAQSSELPPPRPMMRIDAARGGEHAARLDHRRYPDSRRNRGSGTSRCRRRPAASTACATYPAASMPAIGDQQRARESQLPRQRCPDRSNRAFARNDPGADLKVECHRATSSPRAPRAGCGS